MKFRDLVHVSMKTTISNKLRTGLSMLGVIIGVITIILVVAIGAGAQKQVEEQFKNLSVNSIFVFPMRGFKLDADAVDLVKSSRYIEDAAGFAQGSYAMSSTDYDGTYGVLGVTPSYLDIVNIEVLHGSSLDLADEKQKTVLLGRGIFEQLYPEQDPEEVVGSFLVLKKKEYLIKGILKETGGGFGPLSFDDSVYTSLATYEKYLDKKDPTVRVSALVTDVDWVSKAVDDITDLLYEAYDIDSSENALRVMDAGSSVVAAQENAKTLNVLLIGMAAIVFVVSGIGIMNVMFASVAERTKEIGILKSIGADRKSILNQFLLESIILTFFASLIGVVFGEVIIALDVLGSALPLLRSSYGDIIAVVFALVTGVFFGRYPAWRAARLDPVDALRS